MDMNTTTQQYSIFVLKDTAKMIAAATAIYSTALLAYWLTIG